jgi:hypothetical protein
MGKYDFSTTALLNSGEETLPTPLRLSPETLKAMETTIQGYTFLLIGNVLVCPSCGKISGVKAVRDLDEQLNFFLAFGCEHYKNSTALTPNEEAAVDEVEETVAQTPIPDITIQEPQQHPQE